MWVFVWCHDLYVGFCWNSRSSRNGKKCLFSTTILLEITSPFASVREPSPHICVTFGFKGRYSICKNCVHIANYCALTLPGGTMCCYVGFWWLWNNRRIHIPFLVFTLIYEILMLRKKLGCCCRWKVCNPQLRSKQKCESSAVMPYNIPM